MICPKCGNKIQDTTNNCGFCGYQITENDILDVTPSEQEHADNKIEKKHSNIKIEFSSLSYLILSIICYPAIILLYIIFGLSINFYLSIGVVLLIILLSSYMLGTTYKGPIKIYEIANLTTLISLIVICVSIAIFLLIGYDNKESVLDKIAFSLILISGLTLIQSLVLSLLTKRK